MLIFPVDMELHERFFRVEEQVEPVSVPEAPGNGCAGAGWVLWLMISTLEI